jgi:hypothetical protein
VVRLAAAHRLGARAARQIVRRSAGWPESSPGAANAWLLLVTGKPPTWRDSLMIWPEGPPTLGEPHQGFFYPDPLGFWTEVRRWATILVRTRAPGMEVSDALSVTALLHIGDSGERLARATERCQPVVTLFLDEAARASSGAPVGGHPYVIPDPHRPGTVYEGWWQRTPGRRAVGKAPQHPASHKLYRHADMDIFLRAVPVSAG